MTACAAPEASAPVPVCQWGAGMRPVIDCGGPDMWGTCPLDPIAWDDECFPTWRVSGWVECPYGVATCAEGVTPVCVPIVGPGCPP